MAARERNAGEFGGRPYRKGLVGFSIARVCNFGANYDIVAVLESPRPLRKRPARQIGMLGVLADPSEHSVARELFEMFKTPWEFYREGQRYDVLLCAGGGCCQEDAASLILIYAGGKLPSDSDEKISLSSRTSNNSLSYLGAPFPIYGDCIMFRERGMGFVIDEELQQEVMYRYRTGKAAVVRIGYDLFSEVRTLLTVGQPVRYAGIATLDLHIALLRDLIVGNGIPLVEVPPVPDGFQFTACLTHDVDHPMIRKHKWDHTMFGFLYRATVGSFISLLRGRTSIGNAFTNWIAALKLPFVYLGLAKDFWGVFADHYLELEKGLSPTFFIIPSKGYPGRNSTGLAPQFRAAGYRAEDIADVVTKITEAGGEVGLHGIDAWLDSSSGREELQEIRRLTGRSEIGVRMHWLYYDQQSPLALEQAEAGYDSTIGYTETVGYRAGTTQVYKPLQAVTLLELPLHVMDTALFYPDYLGLSSLQASALLNSMIDNAVEFGGCMTINWHDRSILPERLWDACYRDLIRELTSRDVWFATAERAISWFKKRRSVVFERDSAGSDAVFAKITADSSASLPGLRLRIHRPFGSGASGTNCYNDISLDESLGAWVPMGVNA